MPNSLADRLEQAECRSQALNQAIEIAIGYARQHPCHLSHENGDVMSLPGHPDYGHGGQGYIPPDYTGSLDAAVTLVPEGWADISMLNSNGYYEATLNNHNIKRTAWGHNDHSFALALSAAAIRALKGDNHAERK